MSEQRHVCLVCGYPGLSVPPYVPGPVRPSPSYEICACCFWEPGFDDDNSGFTFDQWRAQWIAAGMPWCGHADRRPDGWDPREQLRRIGF